MQFIVLDSDTPTPSASPTSNPLGATPSNNKEEGVVIYAHRCNAVLLLLIEYLIRVILAARSEWFSKALQSGMIEDRNRK